MTECNRGLFYCIDWPEAQKWEENDECYTAYDGFSMVVFVPKELYEKSNL